MLLCILLRQLLHFNACCTGLIVPARLILFEKLGFSCSVSCRAESPPSWPSSEVPSFANCCSSLLFSELHSEQIFLGKNNSCVLIKNSRILLLLGLRWEGGGVATKCVILKAEILGWVAVLELAVLRLPDKWVLSKPEISCLLSEMGGILLSCSLTSRLYQSLQKSPKLHAQI